MVQLLVPHLRHHGPFLTRPPGTHAYGPDRTESPSDSGPFAKLGRARLRRGKKILRPPAISAKRPFRPPFAANLARAGGAVAHPWAAFRAECPPNAYLREN